ncbi:uncharacterized protein TNCT_251071 [Trichonephila clavata]|uniref:C-type lectin domain-containing protein n=1 Tax=Trichonephila clavata TaxID=2740835 RepID=A0A8X6GHD2_TRICU|nr:uncharacterized protein TNCT_251071 [Trichonephila clavata]
MHLPRNKSFNEDYTMGEKLKTNDTFVQKCDNISDNCQCHSTFVNYYYELKGQKNITKNCLKMFTRKLNWSDAEMTCKLEYSHLLNDRMDRSFFQEFESKGEFL